MADGFDMMADALAFFESDMPVSAWTTGGDQGTAADFTDPLRFVGMHAKALGRKFEVADITHTGAAGTALYDSAAEWLKGQQHHWSSWIRELATKYQRGGGLTDGQAKGVLNVMVADYRTATEKRAAPVRPAMAVKPAAPVTPKVATDDDDAAYDAWTSHVAAKISKGYYTIARESGHRTFKLSEWKVDTYRPGAKMRWISLLVGPSNTDNYELCGMQKDDGSFTLIRSFKGNTNITADLALLLYGTQDERDGMRMAYAMESGTCARCNRLLTVPASLHRGLGAECASKVSF